jgi:hypothetical protein
MKTLHVNPGTRLELIQRTAEGWKVWVSVLNRQVPPEKYRGAYLLLKPDGSVVQRSTETEEEWEVMEKNHEQH